MYQLINQVKQINFAFYTIVLLNHGKMSNMESKAKTEKNKKNSDKIRIKNINQKEIIIYNLMVNTNPV